MPTASASSRSHLQLNDEALRWLGIGSGPGVLFIAALSARAEA